ncbi:MAG: metallophosphoesterase family protein [Saccharofermentanales bacterium]
MKIVVFSDSHSDIDTMLDVVQAESPDTILHLGDHISDGIALQNIQDITVCLVKGNSDMANDGRDELLLTYEKKLIYMTHGHLYNVKESLTALFYKGINVGAHIVLFGHTHVPYINYANGIWFMNPGRIGRKSSKVIHATYGIIRLVDDKIACEILEV